MNGAQAKKAFSYILLPQVIPRAKALFASGFGYIAFLMASIYGSVRLLPPHHPYLNPANIGKFGLHHVIGEAANNLTLKKENIDQIMVFIALLSGVVILFLQIALIIYGMVFKSAFAGSIFLTPDPIASGGTTPDLAFMVLDKVFGIPDLFCTVGNVCSAINGSLPEPFHVGFHEMLRFYSLGMLIIGVIIFLYYVLIVVGETATTGHPFGQRFQNAWVPVRLVVALGLLIPINYGLNSSQYIVLYAAKYGSGFATNGWQQFNSAIRTGSVFPGGTGANPLGERTTLLARPKPPSVAPIVQTMSLVNACAYAWWKTDPNANINHRPPNNNFYIKPYLVKLAKSWNTNSNDQQLLTAGTTYAQAVDFFNGGDIVIRFGRIDTGGSTNYNRDLGKVAPYCGDVRIPITYMRTVGQGATLGGADAMQEFYFNTIKRLWFQDGLVRQMSFRYMSTAMHRFPDDKCLIGCMYPSLPACVTVPPGPPLFIPSCGSMPQVGVGAKQTAVNELQTLFNTELERAWTAYNTNATDIELKPEVLDRGWAGAGIWYNTIADINGAFASAVVSFPSFQAMPRVMEAVREERRKSDSDPSPLEQFSPNLKDGKSVTIDGPANSLEVAQKLNDFYKWWNNEDPDMAKADATVKGGIFQDAIRAIFGINGLLEMRGDNADIHPLAQLSMVGKSLVDSAILNIGTSTITAGIGGSLRATDKAGLGPVADIASGMMMTIAFLGLTVGFILYYVLPFLPFLYFFFAFGTWVKSIFEAMVGAPLWALAHLRLDGEGLPGDSASSGYFLIFEIFIRPILTVFGLVAAILILTAQVRMLNILWTLVTNNLTGFESYETTAPGELTEITFTNYDFKVLPKNEIDQFFFTIVYAIIVYMMATASFKMIDKIPDQLLRFMGAGVSAFSDINPDPTEGLTRYAALGGITVGREATQGLRTLSGSVGGALGRELEGLGQQIVPPRGPGT